MDLLTAQFAIGVVVGVFIGLISALAANWEP